MLVLLKPGDYFNDAWIKHFKVSIDNSSITNNLVDYLDSNDPLKIAFLQLSSNNFDTELPLIDKVSKNVFYFIDHPTWVEHLNLKRFQNVYWVMPGEFKNSDGIKGVFWNYWMGAISNTYKDDLFKDCLKKLKPFEDKPKYFSAILGQQRSHRDKVANFILNESLLDKVILNYSAMNKISTPKWNEPGLIETGHGYESRYYGIELPSYNVVPVELYNQTAYSIVAETISQNNIIFFTEKVAKPIIAKRLFIMFTSPGYLEKLRDIGFRTFDSVIDESYDKIFDEEQRFKAAFEQIKYLCSMPQTKILEQIQPVVEHNFKQLFETNWDQLTIDNINNIIK